MWHSLDFSINFFDYPHLMRNLYHYSKPYPPPPYCTTSSPFPPHPPPPCTTLSSPTLLTHSTRYFIGPLCMLLYITSLVHLRKCCFIWQSNVLSDILLFDFTQWVVLFESSLFCMILLNVLLEYQFFHVMLRIVLFEYASLHFLFACFI